MEIFQDGELEEELRKRDYQAHNLSAIWQLFISSYQEAIQSLTCPVRATYSIEDLGSTTFRISPSDDSPEREALETNAAVFTREDLQLANSRGEVLECSFWRAANSESKKIPKPPPPCIVYLHGMSSSRKECVYIRDKILSTGFSLFTLDLSGSGSSEGDRVSYGHFEKSDLRTVLDFLFATNKASRVGIWGRCMGGSTALLYLCESVDYGYKRLRVLKRDAARFQIAQCKQTGDILCVRPGRVFSFRVSQLSASNGDFVVLSINNQSVKGLDVAECKRLLMENTNEAVEIAGYELVGGGGAVHTPAGASDTPPFVFALALDSTFGDMERVIADMFTEVGKSAEKRNVVFPHAMMTAASKIISRSVRKSAGYQFKDIAVLGAVRRLRMPCQFVSASRVDFIRPEHTRAIYDAYGGEKHWLSFDGTHDQNRPDDVVDRVCRHFARQLALAK